MHGSSASRFATSQRTIQFGRERPFSLDETNLQRLRRRALRTLNDEDLSQEAMIACWQAPEGADPALYLAGTVRRLRSSGIAAKIADRRHVGYDDEILTDTDSSEVLDWETIPQGLRPLASMMLEGYTLKEIAGSQGTTPAALKMKLSRHRKKLN
jgi:DNA-directed RNA polymerase specialized sigma24 family protein